MNPTVDFGSWLLSQWYRLDEIGELAVVASNDPKYPNPAPFATVRDYVLSTIKKSSGHVHISQIALMHRAKLEYMRVQDNARAARFDACSIIAELRRGGYVVTAMVTSSPDIYGIAIQGPGIRPGGEESLRSALPPELYRRFSTRRDAIARVLINTSRRPAEEIAP